MTTRKVCKSCKIFVKGDTCPICKGTQFTTNWKGRINILNLDKSIIAKKAGAKAKGEYAIRVR
jgi:RNA polymerase subunit RPABC4/transcription elongation factor Spt4